MNSSLYQGILDDAKNQAVEIISTTEKQVSKRKEQSKKEIQEALDQQTAGYERNLKVLDMRYESQKRSIIRRNKLKRQSSISSAVLTEVKNEFQNLPKRKDYSEIMIFLITEGAMGISCDEAIVNYGKNDKVDESMLREAEKRVKKETGKDVKLTLGFNGLEEHGVIVSNKDGRISFNNEMSSRIRRFSREINEFVEGLACKIE